MVLKQPQKQQLTRIDWEQALLADPGLPHRAAQKPTAVSSEGMLMAEAL